MSLLDLKSDLSKFRYNAPKPTTTLPKNKPTNNYGDNFGSYKPITDGLIDNRPGVTQPKNINLPDKLKDTRLDDTIRKTFEEMLINSVSEYSPKNIESNFGSPSRISLESIVSAFSKISKDVVQSSIDKSDTVVSKTQQGTNNNESNVEIIDNGSEVGNITNPNVTLNNIPLTYERENQSADITANPDDARDNIQNPDVILNNIPLTYNRELQSADLNKGFSSREFIVNANSNKLLSDSILNIDRTPEKYRTQSRIENKEITQKVDTTRYNGQISDLAISDSILDLTNPEKTLLAGRHETDTNSLLSNSKDNVVDYFGNENAEGFTKNIEPLTTEYVNNSSTLGYETLLEANYFDITNQYTTDGFHSFAREYDSKYKPDASKYDWEGSRENAPEANYFDVNKKFTKGGFTSFAEKFNTEYKTDSSEFDWDGIRQNAPNVNYFDLTGANTTTGFHTFALEYDSKYVNGSSKYDWDGERNDAPEVNYFDRIYRHTFQGFHKFAVTKEPTSYTNDGISLLSGGPGVGTSDFDWDGLSINAPTNDAFNPNGYFDQTNRFTTQGFHTFAQLYDTKYIPESSEFDWDGLRAQAPTNDINNPNGYFDQTNRFTTQGFHTFAQIYDTKYIPESSEFDWDGLRAQAPTNDANNPNGYFDITKKFTTRGFHTFAQLYDTKYIPESSEFDWDGTRSQAPTNDINNPNGYFDQTNRFTTIGFHTFAQIYDTKYIPESSGFDWDGNRSQAPTNDANNPNGYFDITNKFTTKGFHTFAQLYDTKYIPESSEFDWDGLRNQAPTNDINNPNGYFDQTNRFTTIGFHTFAQLYDTKYIPESSGFDWDGNRSQAPTNDANNPNGYFDITNKFTTKGFHTFAQIKDTKYVPESSEFDWDGTRSQAPTNDFLNSNGYFDQNNRFTTRGFHTFAQIKDTKYIPESSEFDWDGLRNQAPTNDFLNPNGYFDQTNRFTTRGFHTFAQIYDTKYVPESSEFDWDGNRSQAPTNDINNPNGYFDQNNRFTFRGFHNFASPLEATSYTNTNQGLPVTNGGVFLLGGQIGNGTSDLDWDGGGAQFNAVTTQVSPTVNYLDLTNRSTFRGFHIFAQPREATSYTNTNQGQPITTGGVSLLGGPLGFGTSDLDWDGLRNQAPTNDFLNPNGYFDQNNRVTFRGFHTFAQPREATSYTNTSQAVPVIGGGVTLLPGALGFGTSDLDWDGLRNQAPTNDIFNPNGYFDQNNIATRRGFHTFATPLEPTSYQTVALSNVLSLAPNASTLDWNGTDPYSMGATRFFGFTQSNPFGFMVGMTQFDGTAYPIINPQFNPSILSLSGLPQKAQRFALSSFRQILQPLQTNNLEQFAPLSFGGKTISGFKATLDNQSPVVNVQKYGFNITGYRRRGKSAGQVVDQNLSTSFLINQSTFLPFMDVNRYTLGGGVDSRPTYVDGEMAVWANSGDVPAAFQTFSTVGNSNLTAAQVVALNRSFNGLPYYNGVLYKSHIDYQYSKYNLVRDSYNTSTTFPQPFIDSSLNGEDRNFIAGLRAGNNIPNSMTIPGGTTVDLTGVKNAINEAVNFLDSAQSFDEGIVRGGIVKNTISALIDAKRITKFLLSPKGLLWNVKQVGLQFMNPRVDTGTGIFDGVLGLNWTNIYNPLSVPLNVAGRAGILGLRLTRHGVLMTGEGAYEDITVDRANNSNNRTFDDFSTPSFFNRTSNYNRLIALTKELLPSAYKPILLNDNVSANNAYALPTQNTKTEIDRISTTFGGPNSFLGLFGTTINRATHPYKVMNDTGYFPTKENIERGSDREVFWGSTAKSEAIENFALLSTVFGPFTTRIGAERYGDFLNQYGWTASSGVPTHRSNEMPFGGIILALKNYMQSYRKAGKFAPSARRAEKLGMPPEPPYGVQKVTAKRLYETGFDRASHPSTSDRTRAITTFKSSTNIPLYMSRKDNIDQSPIKNYQTTPYGRFGFKSDNYNSLSVVHNKLMDFRGSFAADNVAKTFNSDPTVIDFKNNNLEKRFGVGSPGEPGNNRGNVFVNTIQYSSLLPASSVGTTKRNEDGTLYSEGNQILSNYRYGAYPTQKPNKLEVTTGQEERYQGDVINPITGELEPGRGTINTQTSQTFDIPKFRGDRINIIDWKRSTTGLSADYVYEKFKNFSSLNNSSKEIDSAEDLIQFYFSSPNLKASEYLPTEAIVFRAYIDTIVDNHKPSWTPIKYIGRADPVYSYDGYERDINFGFTVHIGSRDELKASWRKLNMLASWTAPQYIDSGFMKAPVIRLNLGNLYRKFPGFLSTLTYTFDNTQTTWETAKLKQDKDFSDVYNRALSMPGALELPKTINVQCTFVTFNIYRPEWDCVFYSLFDDSTSDGSIETGLAPQHDNKVNYFRTFDDLPASHPMNSDLCAIIGAPEKPKPPVEEKREVKQEPPPKTVETKCLCPIEFCVDEDRYVKEASESVIEELAKWLKEECDCARITLIGHANNINNYALDGKKDLERRDRSYNLDLSRSRARTVKGILVDKYGIDQTRILTEGVGYLRPLNPKNPAAKENIRIEVRIDNKDEASGCKQISFECKDNSKCPTLPSCERRNQGDRSQFWLVGPQYFTYKYVEDTGYGGMGPISDALKAISEKVDGEWWVPVDGNSWRTLWAGRGYKVKGYAGRGGTYGDTKSRYSTKGGTISAYRPNPDHQGPLLVDEVL